MNRLIHFCLHQKLVVILLLTGPLGWFILYLAMRNSDKTDRS